MRQLIRNPGLVEAGESICKYSFCLSWKPLIKLHMSCWSPFSLIEKQNGPAAAAYMCLRCHCPMLIISQNAEIWIVQGLFGVSTLCTVLVAALTVFITRVMRKYWYSRLRGSRLISRFFIVIFWIKWTCDFLAFGGSLGCSSATVFFPFCFCGPCLRQPSCSCGDLERSLTRFFGSTVAQSSSASFEDECGGVRSRDLDLSSLLERPLCSADGGGPVAGDEGFMSEKSSSDTSTASGVTIGWVCGSCSTCAWGYTRSRDLDRHRCLSSCGEWSSSPSFIGVWISWGSGGEGRRGNRSRDVLSGPTHSLSPACDGAGGHPGGRPGWPGGPGGPGRSGGPLGPKGTSGSSKNFGGDGYG